LADEFTYFLWQDRRVAVIGGVFKELGVPDKKLSPSNPRTSAIKKIMPHCPAMFPHVASGGEQPAPGHSAHIIHCIESSGTWRKKNFRTKHYQSI